MSSDPPQNEGRIVCVTGASGFLASHLVKQLLQRGYRVHGTVRDATSNKYDWLKSLADGTEGTLTLFSADLMKKGSFDEAVRGCGFVCHVASSTAMTAKDPQKVLVEPTVEGARNVFSSVIKAQTARRVVMTSSVGAISDPSAPPGHVFTEEDWHTELTLEGGAYAMAKTLAEKFAWSICDDQKEGAARGEDGGWCFDLVTIAPVLILGELLDKSQLRGSPLTVQQLLDGTLPLAPDFHWCLVHVHDVALAHILALEKESAHGRYIVGTEEDFSMLQMARVLRERYPTCKAPTWPMPTALLYLVALVNPALTLAMVRRMAGKVSLFSNAKARKELGIDFTPPEKAILDTAQSLVDLGIIPKLE